MDAACVDDQTFPQPANVIAQILCLDLPHFSLQPPNSRAPRWLGFDSS
jgi:hypothetical protein